MSAGRGTLSRGRGENGTVVAFCCGAVTFVTFSRLFKRYRCQGRFSTGGWGFWEMSGVARDLKRDWRRWSAVERLTVKAVGTVLAALALALLLRGIA